MFAIGLALVFTFGLLCAWALAKSAQIGDREARRAFAREAAKQELEDRYWNYRYPSGHWPGKP